ncbi:MAG: hypothetical protein ABEI57_02635 [Halapricum sp.]
MVSRETVVQIGVGIVAIVAFFVVPNALHVPIDSLTGIFLVVSFDATIVGGSHLYLALRGSDTGGFPVRARWRTVALAAGLAAVAFLAQVCYRLTTVPDRWITATALALALAGIGTYWYLEARDGYRESRPQGTI